MKRLSYGTEHACAVLVLLTKGPLLAVEAVSRYSLFTQSSISAVRPYNTRVKTSNFGRTCKIGHFSTSPDIKSCSRLSTNCLVLFQVNCTDKISSYPLPNSENGTRHIIIDKLDIHSSLVTSSSAQFREHMVSMLVTTIFNSIFYS